MTKVPHQQFRDWRKDMWLVVAVMVVLLKRRSTVGRHDKGFGPSGLESIHVLDADVEVWKVTVECPVG